MAPRSLDDALEFDPGDTCRRSPHEFIEPFVQPGRVGLQRRVGELFSSPADPAGAPEHRIGDKRIVRLIQKWLKAGVLDEGIVVVEEKGTGQGAVISPLLANVYLHYVFDLWAHRWRRREAT